jgi:uncharacterized protein YdhG (YjbR/CyaY superfamily)
MPGSRGRYKTIEEYIQVQPAKTQRVLRQMRATIQSAAPRAQQTICYSIPTFQLEGNLVHFAAFKKHIGFYPTPSDTAVFKNELTKYVRGKGSVQFPLDEPLPLKLITRMVKFRVAEQLEKARRKRQKK